MVVPFEPILHFLSKFIFPSTNNLGMADIQSLSEKIISERINHLVSIQQRYL